MEICRMRTLGGKHPAKFLRDTLREVLAGVECYIDEPTAARMKNGNRVYRFAGSGGYHNKHALIRNTNGEICVRDWDLDQSKEAGYRITLVPVSGPEDPRIYDWEYHVINRDPAELTRQLKRAIEATGEATVDVRVG